MIINEDQPDRKQEMINKTNSILSQYAIPNTIIKFDLSGDKAAGIAYCNINLIQYNIKHVIYNYEHMLNDIVPHEAAHIIAYKKYGSGIGHDAKWINIMKELGIADPQRYHTLEPVWRKHKAPCCGRPITTQLYNKAKKGLFTICVCGKIFRFD